MIEIQSSRAAHTPGVGGSVISKIEDHILKAVNESIRRAYAGGESTLSISDRKPDASPSGTLQDCEFGLMVLKSLDWLKERNRLEGDLADSDKLTNLVVNLVQGAVKKITTSNIRFGGGQLKDSPVFFSGEPYTLYKSDIGNAFSANLDAAMLIVAFLSSALEKFDQSLAAIEYVPEEKLKKLGIRTLRDAALFVCHEGFLYATKCRVLDQGRFVGYTCDPTSNRPGSEHGSLDDYDRLFFTWTTCETLYELSDWTSYLTSVEQAGSASAIVKDSKNLLEDLKQDLKRASTWCHETFLELFRENLKPENAPSVSPIVTDFGRLRQDEPPSTDLAEKYRELVEHVSHVYHLSQYAAIRSIEPLDLRVEEVRDILNGLETLVGQHVLSSGLDAASHEYLFKALTRRYNLGSSNREPYKDDAYFPLVVRSLSGLLTRTIIDLKKKLSHEELRFLVIEFQRSLKARYENLIERRPKALEPGDEYLWSFVVGGPYVLYATQRTVFALIEYATFLQEADRLLERPPDPPDLEIQLTELLAKNLAEVLLSKVARNVVESFTGRLRARSESGDGNEHLPHPIIALPKAEWTHEAMLGWLANFTASFEEQQIENLLAQYAGKLIWLREQQLDPKKGAQGTRRHMIMVREFTELLKRIPELDALYEKGPWEQSNIIRILFKYTFEEVFSFAEGLRQRIEKTTLMETIDSSVNKLKSPPKE